MSDQSLNQSDGFEKNPDEEKHYESLTILPWAVKRLYTRAARLRRLVELDAPDVVLEHGQRLAYAAALEASEWMRRYAIAPATELIEKRSEDHLRDEYNAHLKARHPGQMPRPTVDEAIEAHRTLHEAGGCDHDEGATTEDEVAAGPLRMTWQEWNAAGDFGIVDADGFRGLGLPPDGLYTEEEFIQRLPMCTTRPTRPS